MPVVSIDPIKKAEIDRAKAIEAVTDWFDGQVAEGWTTPGGFKLGLATTDVTLLTGNYVLAKEAAALGGDIPPVVDMNGVPHPIEDIEELTELMLGYGSYRAQLSAEYATRMAAIDSQEQ